VPDPPNPRHRRSIDERQSSALQGLTPGRELAHRLESSTSRWAV